MADAPVDPYKGLPFKDKRMKFSSHSPFTPTLITSLLAQASDPVDIYATRIQGRQMLLENPAKQSKGKRQAEEKRLRRLAQLERRQLGVTSKKVAKERGYWKFDKSQVKFDNMLPLHHLWMGYMSELLGLSQPVPTEYDIDAVKDISDSTSMQAKLVKADLHGSIISVHQSKNTSTLALSGIVILDTENTLVIVTKQDKVKIIPKQNSIFILSVPLSGTSSRQHRDAPIPATPSHGQSTTDSALHQKILPLTVLDVPHVEFELYGNQFRFHSADRTSRKFKHKETIELY